MQRAAALVLAGGHIEGYGVLTRNRAKAALPFGGFFRIVDFCLTSLARSGIERVGLICQYLPASLIEHVGTGAPWGLNGFGREIRIMPPFVGVGKIEWYRGTADAIYQNLNLVYDWNPSYVIICSGEHIYNMDFGEVVAFHESEGNDLTIVEKQLPPERLSERFGYVTSDETGRVSRFDEKPHRPPCDRVSIGVYVFTTDVLIEQLERLGQGEKCFNLARDIIPPMVKTHKVMTYRFDGYWNYLETVGDYYKANLSLLDDSPEIDLEGWEVLTNLEDRSLGRRPSGFFGPSAEVADSLIGPGCRIEGRVERSIISPGVVVERGALVSHSILMHDTLVKEGARVHQTIADKDVVFERNCKVGFEADDSPDAPIRLTLVGKRFVVEPDLSSVWWPGPGFVGREERR